MQPRPRIPSAILALGFVSLLMDVSPELIHSLLPVFLVTTLGASALALGLIEGAAEATALIVKVFSGGLSDFFGRRKPIAVLGYGLGVLSVALLAFGVREPERAPGAPRVNPIRRDKLRQLGNAYWWVVAVGAVFTLARFSEAFLVLRAVDAGLTMAWTPLVFVGMNLVYSVAAYPFGKLADKVSHARLLALGMVVLIAADVLLALGANGITVGCGIALWGLHLGITQGLLATMVAAAAPPALRGTAFGLFNLASGVAMLVASALAGLLWDRLGGGATFATGALFSVLALGVLLLRRVPPQAATQRP